MPEHVEAAVERALEKLPADRFATAREFADALTGKGIVSTAHVTAAVGAVAGARGLRTPRERGLAIALGTVVVLWAVTGVLAVRPLPPAADAPVVRFEVATPSTISQLQITLSPDCRTVVFAGSFLGGRTNLWARPLAATEAAPISGTEGAGTSSFWSPDSRQIGFVADRRLKRVALAGGAAETICEATGVIRGASWNADNVIVFSKDGEMYRVPATGGVPVKVSVSAPRAGRWEHPWFLPDGEHFLILARGGDAAARGVYVASLAGGTPTRIDDGDTRVAFVPPGQLIYVREQALYARPFDARAMRFTGEQVRIADDVGDNPANGAAGFGTRVAWRIAGSEREGWHSSSGSPATASRWRRSAIRSGSSSLRFHPMAGVSPSRRLPPRMPARGTSGPWTSPATSRAG